MDNYQIASKRAQAYFLQFDQGSIICNWKLRHDEDHLYVTFFGKEYAICRKTGEITRLEEGLQAGFSEVLSIFDFLCHEGEGKFLTGRYAPVNSLKNAPKAGGVETNFHSQTAKTFDADPEKFRAACLALGGKAVDMGDMGFEFPLFEQMKVRLKFYRADEEFPAAVTLLWDENTLQYIFYETVFYVAGFLLQQILQQMKGDSTDALH